MGLFENDAEEKVRLESACKSIKDFSNGISSLKSAALDAGLAFTAISQNKKQKIVAQNSRAKKKKG